MRLKSSIIPYSVQHPTKAFERNFFKKKIYFRIACIVLDWIREYLISDVCDEFQIMFDSFSARPTKYFLRTYQEVTDTRK